METWVTTYSLVFGKNNFSNLSYFFIFYLGFLYSSSKYLVTQWKVLSFLKSLGKEPKGEPYEVPIRQLFSYFLRCVTPQ